MNKYIVRVSFRYADAQGIMLEDLKHVNAECGIDALSLIEDEMESRGFKDILFKGLRDMTNNVWIIDEKGANERFIECKWIEFNQLKDLLELERRVDLLEHEIKEYRSFRISMIQATSQKGAKVRIIDERFQNSKSIPYDYQIGNYVKMGIAYLYGKGIVVKGIVTKRNEILLLSDDLSKGL